MAISPSDLEDAFRGVNNKLEQVKDDSGPSAAGVAVIVAALGIVISFLTGQRQTKKSSTIVEIRSE